MENRYRNVLIEVPEQDNLVGVVIYSDGTFETDDHPCSGGYWDLEEDGVNVRWNSGHTEFWNKETDITYDYIMRALIDKEIESLLTNSETTIVYK